MSQVGVKKTSVEKAQLHGVSLSTSPPATRGKSQTVYVTSKLLDHKLHVAAVNYN